MKQQTSIFPPVTVRAYFSTIGRRGGQRKSPKQLAAVKKNLKRAQALRWAGHDKPEV